MTIITIVQACAEIDRREHAYSDLHIECGELQQEVAELKDVLGRSEDRLP